jgi:uncharacterized protein YlxW (UPF0749 family)
MDVAIAVVALLIAVVSLSAAINFGRSQTRLQAELATLHDGLQRTQADAARTQAEVERAHAELDRAHVEIAAAQGALTELKVLAETPAPPPLLRTRPDGLDDLRQQLRAAHAEEEESNTD